MRHAVAVVVLLLCVTTVSAATFSSVPSDQELLERADVVVVGRVLSSTSRQSTSQMIHTDHQLAIEQVLKGSVAVETLTVSELGGFSNGRGLVVPGSASYEAGARVLAFLRQREDGTFFTACMALGKFRFVSSRGIETLVRDADGLEIESKGSLLEARPALEFIQYLRDGAPPAAPRPAFIETTGRPEFQPVTNASAAAYALKASSPSPLPLRWDCPGPGTCTKSWTVGSPQQGTVNTAEAVDDAMAAWTDDPNSWIKLSIGGFNAHTGATNDDINDIIFNTNDTTFSTNCDGSVGCSIIWHNAEQHTFDGDTFYKIVSSDVLIRPVTFTQSAFEGVLAHELGHGIGTRHSNQGTPSSSNALMNSSVPSGASLRAWDQEAVAEMYGNGLPCQPVAITSNTSSGTVTSGNTKTLTVSVSGSSPFTYQWYEGTAGTTTSPVGTNSSSYTTPAIFEQRKFWVRVTNGCGSADSPTITISPCSPPSITTQPSSQTITTGSSATLTVQATGATSYQWYRGNVGDTSTPVSSSQSFTTPQLNTTTSYWVRVTNSCGSTNSNLATITVTQQCVPASITTQPVSQTINAGTTATLTVAANGTAPLSYQWYQGAVGDTSTPVSTSQTFTTPQLNTTTSYWVRVSNSCPNGTANSNLATITVTQQCVPVSITSQPANPATSVGSGITLVVGTGGTAPFTFQWYTGESPDTSQPVVGETTHAYAVPPFATAGTFKFWVRVTNACGSVNSATINVTVSCPLLEVPVISAPPASPATAGYDVTWSSEDAASQISAYELQEATNAGFTANLKTFVVVGATTKHIDPHTEITTDARFYYRVLAVNACNSVKTSYSTATSTLVTAPLPETSNEFSISVPEGVKQSFTQDYLVPGFGETATNNDTFSITTDVPWLTVFPSSGALSAGGTTVQFTFDTSPLDVGATTATIVVNRVNATAVTGGVVTHGSTPAIALPFTVSLVTPVSPVPRDKTPPPGTLIIPAIAHADGIGTRFQSDVRIANTSDQPITYQLSFTPSGVNGTQVGKQTTLTIAAKDSKGLDDIVKAWYGSGVLGESGLGTLEIRPLDGANPLATFASSRTYAISSAGTLGQFIPAISLDAFVGNIAQNPLAKISLQQIANSAAYRTNIGFVEGAGQSAEMLIKLIDGNGQVLQSVTRAIQPYQHEQLSFASVFGNVPVTDGRIEVNVTSPGGKVTAYASVVDNKTSDPLLVFPVQAAATTAQHYVAPGIAELNNGASNFHSDMRVFNGGSAPAPVSLRYYEQGSSTPNPTVVQRTIEPGQVLALDNILPTLWGLTASGGAVTVDAPANASLVVTARTYSRDSQLGTYGQFIPGVTSRDAVGFGERSLELLQLEESAQYRTNLGLVEVTGKGVDLEISAYKPDTKITAVVPFHLNANQFIQLGFVFKDRFQMPTVYQGRISVKVVGGEGRVAAYGSVVDNRTVDPTYVPAQ